MRFIALLLLAAFAVACDDTADLLAEGRVTDACFKAGDNDRDHELVERWFEANARVRMSVVPQQTLADALGGPVSLGDGDPLAYDVDGTIATLSEARVALSVQSEAPLSTLVEKMPAIAIADRAPVPAVVDPTSLVPTPRPARPRASHFARDFFNDPVGSIIEGTFAVAGGVGQVIGAAIATPIVVVGSVIGGFFDALGSIFSGGGGSAPSAPTERLALHRLEVVDGSPVDALLDAREQQDAVVALSAEHAEQELVAQTERARRLVLLDDVNVLTPGDCARGRCRVLLGAPPSTVGAFVRFERERFFGGTDFCEVGWDAAVVVTGIRADVASAADATPSAELIATTRITTPLSKQTPTWAATHSVGLPVGKAAKAAKPTNVGTIADLECTVTVKERRFDVDGSAPDLLVRATVGFARSRATSLMLGHNVTSTRFIVHDASVVSGERVRLSFASAGDRSLGGAIVTFDGTAPLLLENTAFRAVCGPAPAPDAAALAKLVAKADVAVQTLIDDDNTMSAPRPDHAVRAKKVDAAHAAVAAVAAVVGYDDAVVAPMLQAIALAGG